MSLQTIMKTDRLNYLSMFAVLIAIIIATVQIVNERYGEHKVIIASSPSKASIALDGKKIGQTPLSIELKRGTYTLEAIRDGFEPSVHAIYVSEKTKDNVFNLVLTSPAKQPNKKQEPLPASADLTTTEKYNRMIKEFEKLKSMLIHHPNKAVTIPIIHENLRLKSEEIKALRDERKGIKDQYKWFFGSIIAIIIGLLGVIASLFIANRSK